MGFWSAVEKMYALSTKSTLSYLVSAALQCLKTPFCDEREWAHSNCVCCRFARNKMSAVATKSHIRGIELTRSHIVCDRIALAPSNSTSIRQRLLDADDSVAISSNDRARVTPNGCVIHKDDAHALVDTNAFIRNDFERVYIYNDLF